jgi:hypothetical protein
MGTHHYEDIARSSADESEIMLSDFKHAKLEEQDDDNDTFASSHNSLLKRMAFPISLVSNLLFFVFVLFLLAQPCYFSARNCVYEKRDKNAQAGLPLMADVNKIVPERTYLIPVLKYERRERIRADLSQQSQRRRWSS